MKLYIDGDINQYYVQMLSMIFFPGAKFSESEEEDGENPVLHLTYREDDDGAHAYCKVYHKGKNAESERHNPKREDISSDRLKKLTVGDAVISACGDLLGYRPSWGMLVGVRPSKVATELLSSGMSKTRVKKQLTSDYFVIPKKAALATEVAINEARIIGKPDKKDCSIYISIPFCPTRCAYCSFVSYTSKRLLDTIPDYLVKMQSELQQTFDFIKRMGLNLKTIYIGGGTPTILDAHQLEGLLSLIEKNTDVSMLEEYTLECGRPDTITEDKLRVAKQYGVSRISVNPQILNDDVLEKIGRAHNTDCFLRAYDMAKNSGIGIINTDLIAGLPGDKFKTFSDSFDRILALRPENITVHTFSVKNACDALKNDSNIYSMRGGDVGKSVDYSQIKAQHDGYRPYYMYRQKNTVGNFENVGLALPGCEGLYNIYMMEEVHSIFAVGAGAVSKFVDYYPDDQKRKIDRVFNLKYPYEYLAEDRVKENLLAAEKFYIEHNLI